MDPLRREQIQRSLRDLAASYSAALKILEDTLKLLDEEFALDPAVYLQRRGLSGENEKDRRSLVDPKRLSVTYEGKTCFLGNSLPFKFLSRLAREPNAYVSHEELLADVWNERSVSDSALRSVVKMLRSKLREDGLSRLADAIDGTQSGHYSLKLTL
jgi:DNA-binding response OmpR family regulator